MPAEPPADGRGSGDSQGDSLFASTFDAAMLEAGLRGLGVHPDDVVTLLRYAPLALTHMCWRNSILEDWHASPDSRISDADMMRTNVATTRLFHQALWGVFDAQLADASLTCRADLTDDDIEPLTFAFEDVLEVAFASDRALPHGPTLGEVGGDEVSELYDHAENQLAALIGRAEDQGVAVVLTWLAMRGRAACATWWGSPRWPDIVDGFLARLDDPDDPSWERNGLPGDAPPEVTDRQRLRHLLLSAPDELATETLDFCLHRAGLGSAVKN